MAESVSSTALSLPAAEGVPNWRQIVINSGMKHQNEAVQTAATYALSAISELADCAPEVQTFAKEFETKNASSTTQRSISRALGALAYDKFGNGLDDALRCLLGGITVKVSSSLVSTICVATNLACKIQTETYSKSVEARRNCVTSLSEIVVRLMKSSPDCELFVAVIPQDTHIAASTIIDHEPNIRNNTFRV